MVRRFAFLLFAAAAIGQTGCCGRVHAFFYRLTHCGCCSPYYGDCGCGCGPTCAPGPVYSAPCCGAPGAPMMAGAPAGYPQPVFNGAPQPMPGPSVYPSPGVPPMGEKKQ